ncbi:MAG: circularly permuted type 2 ATP-grasp protein, partial [Novosphingobium sp.]
MTAAGTTNFDEMLNGDGTVRPAYSDFCEWYGSQDTSWLKRQDAEAERFFRRIGITFNVYGDDAAEERLIPFDMIPRIITAREWRKLTRGIEQRVRALNAFLQDLYHRQEIIRSGRLPVQALRDNDAFLSQMIGFTPPGGVYTHIVGIDLVRTGPDEFMVLEDNARTPSGVSYMLENRETMMAMFPELFTKIPVRPVSDYPRRLARSLRACAPPAYRGGKRPVVAVLTPGIYNSAYFEHAYLADQMGAELVEGSDLRVMDGRVAMRTTTGYKAIDVIYRRVDDDYLDPLTFNPTSVLG